jgi:hypothetical protein
MIIIRTASSRRSRRGFALRRPCTPAAWFAASHVGRRGVSVLTGLRRSAAAGPSACVAAAATVATVAVGNVHAENAPRPRPSLGEMTHRMEAIEAQLDRLNAPAAVRWTLVSAEALEEGTHVTLTTNKLASVAPDSTRTPVVLVACGSFSPPTVMHLRIMEDAKDQLESTGHYTVVGGYLSPTHGAYGKASLVDMHHRVNMCQVRASV